MFHRDDHFTYEAMLAVTQSILEESAFAYQSGDEQKAKMLKTFALRCQNAKSYDSVLALASRKRSFTVDDSLLDADPWKLSVKNGVIDLKTGELNPHSPSDFITKQSPVVFDSEAKCPLWESFIGSAFNHDTEMIAYLKRIFGYTLTGSNELHDCFIHTGIGLNGKSTALSTIQKLLGTYAVSAHSSTISQRQSGSMTNDIARLAGARFVNIGELPENARLCEQDLKGWVGGDKITARLLHKEFFEFTPVFKLHITSNFRPTLTDSGNGMFRRLKLISWKVSVAPEKIDVDLPNKLTSELSGILNWCLEGLKDYLANGINTPLSVTEDVNSYRYEQDAIAQFLSENTVIQEGYNTKSKDLYAAYTQWTLATGRHALNTTRFGNALRTKDLKSHKSSGLIVYAGIALIPNYY
jgi:putative DNA primase/helicase